MAVLLMAGFMSCSNERVPKVIATEEIIRDEEAGVKSLAILAKFNDGMELGFFVQPNTHNQVSLAYCERGKIPTSGQVFIPDQFKSKGITYSVTAIKQYVFSDCESLASVVIPNSVTSIGEGAFMNCTSINTITIPNSVTNIEDMAFHGCSNLTRIVVGDGNRKYDSRDNCNAIIETASNTLILACRNTTIPNSVTSIGRSAFADCEGLSSVTIPNNVTNIEDYAFFACPDLTKIVVADGNRKYDSRNNCNAIIETASNTLIAACRNTTIPNSVTHIGLHSFQKCVGLTSVTIPNSVESIGESAFGDCPDLTSLTIPNGVTSIGRHAFSGCERLTSIAIPQGVNSIEEWTFASCWELTSVSIPNNVTSIGDYAFFGCKGLKSITIPNSVTSIGDNAFNGCSGLTSVTIPNGVTSIGYDAFRGCTSLNSVTIPRSVTNIGNGAFCGCTGLTSAIIQNPDLQSQYDYVFIGCDNLPSGEYMWIVGTWACDMGSYGTVVVKFDGDGSSGTCTEAQYGSYKTGTYNVSGNALRYKLNGESVTTTIEIEPGHRLSAGGGYYYHKRDEGETKRNENSSNTSSASTQVKKVYSNANDGFVNIRQTPQSKAPVLGVLRNGPEGAILLGTDGEWKKIDCNGIVGYVYEKNVQDTPTEVFKETSAKTASQITKTNTNQATSQSVTEYDGEVYQIVEVMPQFPGGEQKLMEFISNHIQYPQIAREKSIQGRVFVSFIVEPDGSISNVKTTQSIGGGCDEEAVRVVKSMPKWEPGKQKGQAVRVGYQIPISFRLTK